MADVDWNFQLAEQLDWHWREYLRPRLDGLTDAEYRWEPVACAWNVRPRGTGTAQVQAGAGEFVIDLAMAEPDPPPVTTIAWRLGHLIVDVLGARTAWHFDGPRVEYQTHRYPGDAATALDQLDTAYAAWIGGVRGLGPDGLARACGPAEGRWAQAPMAELVLHINREMLHHGAEIALLRDLIPMALRRRDHERGLTMYTKVQAGASMACQVDDGRGSAVVMRDPEGNEFCVV